MNNPQAADTWRSSSRHSVPFQLFVYFALAFLIPWTIAGILLLEPVFLVDRFGPVDMQKPAYYIVFFACVWVPSLLGLVLTRVFEGQSGVRELLGRVFKWRVGGWLPAIVFGIPLYYLATDWVLYELIGLETSSPQYAHHAYGWALALFAGAIILDPGPLGEEVGWRGFATPRLMQVLPFWASELLLGTLWGFWHLPAFYIAGTGQSTLEMGAFMIGAVFLSFTMGAAYAGTGGSVLLAGFVIHYFANQLPDLSGKIWVEVLRFMVLAGVFYVAMRRFTAREENSSSPEAGC